MPSKLEKYYTKNKDKLNLPFNFNEPIQKGDFYKSTKIIDFRYTKFNQIIKPGVIPFGVTHIYFNNLYDQEFEPDVFPESVIEIYFSSYNYIFEKNVLPKSLKKLTIGSTSISITFNLNTLPESMKELCIKGNDIYLENKFPNSLEKLSLICWQQIDLPDIPKSVTHLDLSDLHDESIVQNENFFPSELKYLSLPDTFESLNKCIFPNQLEILNFSGSKDTFMKDGLLPVSVHTIKIKEYQKMILSSLPFSVETIIFTGSIRKNIDDIPITIKKIKIKHKKYAKFFTKIPFDCKIVTYAENNVEDKWFN